MHRSHNEIKYYSSYVPKSDYRAIDCVDIKEEPDTERKKTRDPGTGRQENTQEKKQKRLGP